MVNVCSGLSAIPKPGTAPSVVLTLEVILALITRRLPFLAQAATAALPVEFTLEFFCNQDVPDVPEFTVGDLTALLTPVSGAAFVSASNKLAQTIRHLAWYEFCQCSSGSPTETALPAAPIGAPSLSAAPCSVITQNIRSPIVLAGSQCDPAQYRLDLFPPGPTEQIVYDSLICPPVTLWVRKREPSWTGWTLSGEALEGGPSAVSSQSVFLIDSTKTQGIGSAFFNLSDGGANPQRASSTVSFASYPIAEWPYAAFSCFAQSSPALTSLSLTLAIACDANALAQQCCPPDLGVTNSLARLAAQLSDIQAMLGTSDVLVELGRQTITLEGEAQLALGTRAISVELTALGNEAYTSALGRPRGLMRVGSIRWGDGLGYSWRRFIDADRWTDQRPIGALSVSWQLLSGTTAILKFLG